MMSFVMATPLQGWWIITAGNPYLWVNECGKPRLHRFGHAPFPFSSMC